MRVLVLGCKDYPAFSTPWVHSGGMEVYTERMIRSLADRAQFTVYAAGGESDADARVISLGAARGLRSQPVTLGVRSWRRLAAGGPEYDLLNPQTPLSALVARMAWRRWGIPYVVTVHIFGADPAHAGSWLAARCYSKVQSLVFTDAAAIVPTGRRLGGELRRRYPFVHAKIVEVPAAGEGVREAEKPETTRARWGISTDAFVLLFLGRIVEENGLIELLDSVAKIRQKRRDVKLVIAGTGDDESKVRERIQSMGLAGDVIQLGPVAGQDKLDLLAASDLLVRTSRHEVFPEAYVEALSVGTPVAATPAGDTPHLAEDSGAVALLPFGDTEGQAKILFGLASEPRRLDAMKRSALEYSTRVRWHDRREAYWSVLERAARGGERAA